MIALNVAWVRARSPSRHGSAKAHAVAVETSPLRSKPLNERNGLFSTVGYSESPARTIVTVLEALSVGVVFRVTVTVIVAGFGILVGAV